VPRVAPVPAAAVTFNPHDYRVSVYFDGAIDRDDVLKIMTGLENDGWQLQKLPQRGGALRTRGAAGVNEVRYNPTSPKNEAAAIAIARFVQQANLTRMQITPAPVATMPTNDLEVWISRP
jgi:hypothetical protein